MKSSVLNVLLAAALLIVCLQWACSGRTASSADSSTAIDTASIVINTIMSRTSVRAYTDQDVSPEQVERLLQAAMSAPTAGNKQPWRFIVIRDKAILQQISANLHTMTMAENAPLAIVVCGDTHDTFQGDGFDYWVEDTSAATENLLLAAHAMGLGAVWCGVYPQMKRVEFLRGLLQLPDYLIPLNVIPVGYPAIEQHVKDKWKPKHVRQNTWEGGDVAIPSAQTVVTQPTAPQWRKVDPLELRVSPFSLFTDAMALTAGQGGQGANSMAIGWGGLGILWGKRPVVTVYVEQRRHTLSVMNQNDYFTVEAFPEQYRDVLWNYLGKVSGRDEDKIKGSGLTLRLTELGTPAFEEGRLILECRKIYAAPFNPDGFGDVPREVYANRPLHTVFIGEIVNAWVKEEKR